MYVLATFREDDPQRQRDPIAAHGFASDIMELQGKFKPSRNRPSEDRRRVIARLGQSDFDGAQALAGIVLHNLVRGR